MTELTRFKRMVAILLGMVVVAIGVVGLRAVAGALLRTASGADPAAVFNDVPPAPAQLLDVIAWVPDPGRDGRAMEPATRTVITDAYARALAALDRAGRGDESAPLADYLGGPALEAALDVADSPERPDVATIHLRHDLRLDFYSDDGAVVALGVPQVEVVRVIDGTGNASDGNASDGNVRTVVSTDEEWRLVMLLQDGNWRIQQLETVSVALPGEPAGVRPIAGAVDGVNAVTVSGVDTTWRSFDEAEAIADLDAAAAFGFEAVRVFLAGPEFGAIDLDAFVRFLDLAGERDLAVVPVLFDGSANHAPIEWVDDRAYLAGIVGAAADHPAIVMWDLKNEPDLDDDRSGGPAIVDAWLTRSSAELRRLDPTTPVTIGWSSSAHALRVIGAVDAVSFHHFGDAGSLSTAIDELHPAVGDRPLLVTEFGRPEWLGFVRGSMPAAQAQRVAELAEVLATDDVAGAMIWQLRDTGSPVEQGAVAGRASTSYGLLRADRSERPVADVVRSGRAGVPDAGLSERVRGSLPRTLPAAAAIVVLIASGLAGVRRRRDRVAV